MDSVRQKLRIRNDLYRALLAEFTGTAVLLLIVCGVVAQHVLPKPALNQMIGINIGVGIAIVFGVAISAKLSGGHINPAVSLMFLSFKQLAPLRFLLYFVAQTLGAFAGAAIAYGMYYEALNAYDGGVRAVSGENGTAGVFVSMPAGHLSSFGGFIDQIISTAFFCFAVAHITDKRNSYPAWSQPLIVGLSFVGVSVAFGYNCGNPCNPARDIGPRIFLYLVGYGAEVFTYKDWWFVPLIAPMVGGVVGGWLYQLLIGFHTPQDAEERYVVLTGNQELKPLTQGEDVA